MPSYKCKIAVNDGQIIEKVIQASSVRLIKKQVADDGGFLVNAQRTDDATFFLSFFQSQKLKTKDFYSFNQEFLTLLRAGLPVVMAFDAIIKKQDKTFFSKVLTHIRNEISDGEAISTAFEKYETLFSPLYIASLRSGEASGNIPDAIENYLEYFERSRQIKQKIKAASVYPAILTLCSIFVVAFLIVFVVPTITGTFVEAGAQLPLFTRILLAFSDIIRSYFLVIFSGAGLIIWAVSFYLKTDQGKLVFDTYYLKLPFIGELAVYYATALFTSSLATVLSGGLALNHALNISKGLVTNGFMQAGINSAVMSIEKGEGFARALKKVNIFPDMALRMLAAGEEGGNLEKVLRDVARFYEKEVESRLTIIASTIEPVLMVLMGVVIGFIMLAMYMPIFQMAGTMG